MANYNVPVLEDFVWQPPVKDKDLTGPPGGESKGDRYIVATPADTGDWFGKENDIATYNGSSWTFSTPNEGCQLWVEDENSIYIYTGGYWIKLPSCVDVKLFGAVGDGTTNDHTAITNAITAGRTACIPIYFPPGTYYIGSTTLAIDASNVLIVGAMPNTRYPFETNAPIIKYDGNAEAILVYKDGDTLTNIKIENIYIDAGGTATAALKLQRINNSHFKGISIRMYDEAKGNANVGIHCLRSVNVHVEEFLICGLNDNESEDPDKALCNGIKMESSGGYPCTNVRFSQGRIRYCDNGFSVLGGQDVRFRDCIFEANYLRAGRMTGASTTVVLFDDCWFEQNGTGHHIYGESQRGIFIACTFVAKNYEGSAMAYTFRLPLSCKLDFISCNFGPDQFYDDNTTTNSELHFFDCEYPSGWALAGSYPFGGKVSGLLNNTLVGNAEVGTMTGDETFTAFDGNLFIKDPGGASRKFDPVGTFPVPMMLFLINTANDAETITFDTGGLGQAVAQNERGIFAFDGTNWLKIFVG